MDANKYKNKRYMAEFASKIPDKYNHNETLKPVSCFDDNKNRIYNEAKGFYERHKNNPEKMQDLKSFLVGQEEDRISLDEKYNTKRLEIKNETNTEKAKLYLYKKLSINEQLQSNDWGNKYRKGFIDGLASGGELVENLIDLKPDDIVENLENLDIKENINKGYDKLVSLNREDLIKNMKQAWNETDGIYTIGMMVSGIGIIGKGKEIISGAESLYEIPEYSYLNTKEYKEFFGDIDKSHIQGIGTNAITIIHPTKSDKIVKIAKPGEVDSLELEIEKHQKFYKKLDDIKKDYIINGNIEEISNFYIPKVTRGIDNNKGFFVMDRIQGQNYVTKFYLEHYKKELSDIDSSKLLLMSDNRVEEILLEKKLMLLPKTSSELNDFGFEKVELDLENAFSKYWFYGAKVDKFKRILKDVGYDHSDTHARNFMEDKDGNIYMIDFGKAKIKE